MPTIAFPAVSQPVPHGYSLRLVGNTLTHVSDLTKSTRTLSMPGSRWVFAGTYRSLTERDAGHFQGFFAALEGAGGRFTAWPFHRTWPLGTVRATGATASAAARLATTITAAGLGASRTLLVGDFFGLGGFLYCVTADMAADGSGNGSIAFKPGLRAAHANGAVLTFYRPTTTFKLMSDDSGGVDYAPGRLAEVTIDAEEAFL